MSAAEKRYFKRHYSSEKSLLTELFDFINGMERYDENQIKVYFKSSNLSKNLKVYKVQLFDLLMKSLTSHHNKKNIKSKIRIGLEEVEVLIEKELLDFAKSRIQKLKGICIKYEEFAYLIPVLEVEYQLDNFYTVNSIGIDKSYQLKEINTHAQTLINMFQLRSMYSSLIDQYNHRNIYQLSETEIKEYTSFLNNFDGDNQEQKTIKEQIFTNQIIANIELLLHNNLEKKNDLLKANLELFDEHHYFKEAHPRYYFATLYNYLNSCCNLKKYQELEKGIQSIKDHVEKYPAIRRNLLFVYYLEVQFHYTQENYSKITDELESNIQEHIKKYDQENDSLSARIYNVLIHTYLVLKDPQKGHYYLRRLQIIVKQLTPIHVQYAQILELIGHYDTNDFALIEKTINSIKRKRKKNNDYTPFFLYFLEVLEQMIKTNQKVKSPQLAKAFEEQSQKMKNDPIVNLMKEYTLSEWQKMIEKGLPFSEVKKH